MVQLSHPYMTTGKGKRERYTHLNSECQRIARRDKKALLSEQCKEIEENKLGKTRDLFKEIRDTKGSFHAKMGTIKCRNSKDLKEAEEIKKGWQEYIEELCKKDLHDPDNNNGVITHLESDILEGEVKWALGSITMNKASADDGIPAELFKIQKMMLLKCCTQHASKFGKLSSGHRTGKGQFAFHSQRRAMPKNVQSLHSIPKEGQCQRMFKLLHSCTHFTCQQSNAQNPPS